MHVDMGVQRMVSGMVIRTLIGRFLIVVNILVRVKNLIMNLSDALVVDILTTCAEECPDPYHPEWLSLQVSRSDARCFSWPSVNTCTCPASILPCTIRINLS